MTIYYKALRAMTSLSPVETERLKEEFNVLLPSPEELEQLRLESEIRQRAESFDAPLLMASQSFNMSRKSHCKSPEQCAKEVYKRRKKNKNKKTHRKR